MTFILWLERKWQQLSPEFEKFAWKYAQDIEGWPAENKFSNGQHVGNLPVQSFGQNPRLEKCRFTKAMYLLICFLNCGCN